MVVKERIKKGNTKHIYKSELADMCKIKNVSEKAKEVFKRKPYEVKHDNKYFLERSKSPTGESVYSY